MGKITWSGISEARARLAKLAAGLQAAASGEVMRRAVAKVQSQVEKVAQSKLAKHVYTGAAQGDLVVRADGNLVLLTSNGYLRYHAWWPFRRGSPTTIVSNASKIFEAELVAAIEGKPSPLLLADAEAEAAEAAKRAKREAKEQREADRLRAAAARRNARRERAQQRLERLQTRAARKFAKADARKAKGGE